MHQIDLQKLSQLIINFSVNGTKLQILACFKDGCGAKDIERLDIDVSLR